MRLKLRLNSLFIYASVVLFSVPLIGIIAVRELFRLHSLGLPRL